MHGEGSDTSSHVNNQSTGEVFDVIGKEETTVIPGNMSNWSINADMPNKHEE